MREAHFAPPENKGTGLGELIKYSIFYGVGLIPFAALAVTVGTSFLGAKFVLYYSLFYWIGFMWKSLTALVGAQSEEVQGKIKTAVSVVTALAAIVYIVLIAKFNLYHSEDSLVGILVRFTASVCGVLLVVKAVFAAYRAESKICKVLSLIGTYTLEIYYLHYLFVPHMAKMTHELSSPLGLLGYAIDFVAILLICAVLTVVINASPYLSTVIFGKGTFPKKKEKAEPKKEAEQQA